MKSVIPLVLLLTLFLGQQVKAEQVDPKAVMKSVLDRIKSEAEVTYRTNNNRVYCTVKCCDLKQRNLLFDAFHGTPNCAVTGIKEPPTVCVVLPLDLEQFRKEQISAALEAKARKEALARQAAQPVLTPGHQH